MVRVPSGDRVRPRVVAPPLFVNADPPSTRQTGDVARPPRGLAQLHARPSPVDPPRPILAPRSPATASSFGAPAPSRCRRTPPPRRSPVRRSTTGGTLRRCCRRRSEQRRGQCSGEDGGGSGSGGDDVGTGTGTGSGSGEDAGSGGFGGSSGDVDDGATRRRRATWVRWRWASRTRCVCARTRTAAAAMPVPGDDGASISSMAAGAPTAWRSPLALRAAAPSTAVDCSDPGQLHVRDGRVPLARRRLHGGAAVVSARGWHPLRWRRRRERTACAQRDGRP